MSRFIRNGVIFTALVGALLGGTSCNPGVFSDLEDSTWVQIAERNDTQTSGDFGIAVTAVPAAAGATGVRFIVAAGNPPGFAEIAYDEKGSKTEQNGADGRVDGSNRPEDPLAPLDATNAPEAVVAFGTSGKFLAGVPHLSPPSALLYDSELTTRGVDITPANAKVETGSALATGLLYDGSTAAAPDVVVIGQLSVTVVNGASIGTGNPTSVTCALRRPNAATGDASVGLQTVATANFGGSHQLIIVSGFRAPVDEQNTPRVLIFDASAIQDGMDCPTTGLTLTGALAPVSIVTGNFDGQATGVDIAVGTLATSGKDANVQVFMNVTADVTAQTQPTPVLITPPTGFSGVFGSRLAAANVDGGAVDELIVADANATVKNTIQAGQVSIFKLSTTGGNATPLQALFDPSPSKNEFFGRDVTTTHFPAPTSATQIIAAASKDKLWVYFQSIPGATDPRVK